jgi:hypothetical protein
LTKEITEKKTRSEMDTFMSKLVAESQVTNLLSPKKSRIGSAETQASMEELRKSEAAKR